jgi:DNA-binding NtrC family response regulator
VSREHKDDFSLAAAEKRHIISIFEYFNQNKVQTAKALGISKNTLYTKLVRYGLQKTTGATFKRKRKV